VAKADGLRHSNCFVLNMLSSLGCDRCVSACPPSGLLPVLGNPPLQILRRIVA
jgi:ferredoxin